MDADEPVTAAQPTVEDESASLRREFDQGRDQYLRLLADLDNFRRRSATEHEIRALSSGSSDRDFYEGVAATYRLLRSALREAGAKPVESEGRVFDPTVHEAVPTVPPDGLEPGMIAHEVRRGWRLGDTLLRPAQVVVTTAEEPADRWR